MSLIASLTKNSTLELSNKFEEICQIINDPKNILTAFFKSNTILTTSQTDKIKSILERKEISSISKDVISNSLSYLSFKEITKLKRISKDFNNICNDTKPSALKLSTINCLAIYDENLINSDEKQENLLNLMGRLHKLHIDDNLDKYQTKFFRGLLLNKKMNSLTDFVVDDEVIDENFNGIKLSNYPKLITFDKVLIQHWSYKRIPSSLKHIHIGDCDVTSIGLFSQLQLLHFVMNM